MKFHRLTEIYLLIIASLFTLSFANQCENQCQVCQKAVYQLKFQSQADCSNSACRDTCYKVIEGWNSPTNQYDTFKQDIFGKCEICFRAGFCTISECSDQERNELQIINQIIDTSKITAKISRDDMRGIPFPKVSKKQFNKLQIQNQKIIKQIQTTLTHALKNKSASNFIKHMEELYHSYFDSPDQIPKGTQEIFDNLKHGENLEEISKSEDKIIKGHSVLSNLENKITELQSMASDYKTGKKKLKPETKRKINNAIKNLKNDFGRYQNIFESGIQNLDKEKAKIIAVKQELMNDQAKNKDESNVDVQNESDDEQGGKNVVVVEEKVGKLENELKSMKDDLNAKKEKIKQIMAMFE